MFIIITYFIMSNNSFNLRLTIITLNQLSSVNEEKHDS